MRHLPSGSLWRPSDLKIPIDGQDSDNLRSFPCRPAIESFGAHWPPS